MNDLNQSIKQLADILAEEAKEITAELKDISSKIDAELEASKNAGTNDHA